MITTQPNPHEDAEPVEGVRIVDRRKIDPDTYEVRAVAEPPAATATTPADPAATPPGPGAGDGAALSPVQAEAVAAAESMAAEAVADLQRITAEYANYRKRVDRDRDLHRDIAIGSVVAEMLPILDDIALARSHGDLDGAFKSIAESVEAVARKFGLEQFGVDGEAFDPTVHEAMTSNTREGVAEPTVEKVYQVGYRLRGRVLRPARVGVVDGE